MSTILRSSYATIELHGKTEIERVVAYVTAYSDPVLLGERIHRTFVKMFDESIAGPLDVYHRIARQILEGLEG